jgi:hypothetical protein
MQEQTALSKPHWFLLLIPLSAAKTFILETE